MKEIKERKQFKDILFTQDANLVNITHSPKAYRNTDTTSTSLTKEINKILPNTSLYHATAHESKSDEIATYINVSDSISQKHLVKIIEDLEHKLSKSLYVNGFVIIQHKDFYGNPTRGSFHIYGYNNNAEKDIALKAKLTYEMEDMLKIKKATMVKMEDMLSTLKSISDIKSLDEPMIETINLATA